MVLADAPTDEAVQLNRSFYSPAEVAQLASVSSSTILNYIRAGKLSAVRLSERTYRIPRKSVVRLLELHEPSPRIVREPDGQVSF
jgi:excisionase family DNA binding protein